MIIIKKVIESLSIPEIETFGTLRETKRPPTKASKTYKILPMFPIIGIKIFAKVCALVASLQS